MFSPKRIDLTGGQWFGVLSAGPLGEHRVLLVRTSQKTRCGLVKHLILSPRFQHSPELQ